MMPTYVPTMMPTYVPTMMPTYAPTMMPTYAPTIDPRTNLTKVIKGTMEHFQNDSDITQSVLAEWPNLIALVKTITQKPVSLCIDMPSKILTTDRTDVPGTSMNILLTNINYVMKGALNLSATNGNFYDIAALFFQNIKVQNGDLPYPIITTYDSNGLLSTASIVTKRDGPWSFGLFSRFLPPSVSIPPPSQLGNDPDFMSFVEKMVPFYNSFVPTLSTMDQATSTFDIKTFGKLIGCMLLYKMIDPSYPMQPFVCTSNTIY
jgi:hypothetical protein